MTEAGRRTTGTPVILDANALILGIEHRFPLETEIRRWVEDARIMVPSSVVRELHRLERRRVKGARGALALARKYETYDTDLEGDAAMETLGRELQGWVVTLDRELRSRLESNDVGVLYPCGRQRLCPSRGIIPTRRDAGP